MRHALEWMKAIGFWVAPPFLFGIYCYRGSLWDGLLAGGSLLMGWWLGITIIGAAWEFLVSVRRSMTEAPKPGSKPASF